MDLLSLPRPLGFVLGGGGSLGAVQVGMLRALAERDLFPDLVVGTSVGSLNGAAVALDPSGAANRLSRIWPRITRQMVFPGGPLAQRRMLQQGRTHLFPGTALQALIRGYLAANAQFAELALPFGAVTTDAATAHPARHHRWPARPGATSQHGNSRQLSRSESRRAAALRRRSSGAPWLTPGQS
jgi:NTE family protein